MPIIPLIAPDSSTIVGIKLRDGSVTSFECNFSRPRGIPTFIYLLPKGMAGDLVMKGGENVLVDSNGREWLSSDVEYESTPPLER